MARGERMVNRGCARYGRGVRMSEDGIGISSNIETVCLYRMGSPMHGRVGNCFS